MYYSKKKVPVLLLSLIILSCKFSLAQVNLTDKLPVDPKVKIGKLDNGLTYYIRQNQKPEQKVELRLVVNAGSINEDDDQQGLAHMCEHMAFNGTKNFAKNDIISFLQSIGVQFGNDLNAYTSFDETVYILPVPTDKPANLEKGFQILEDWGHNVTYLDDDIDGERPVILEESRLGKGAEDRMFRKIYPKMFAGSKYSERLPIGKDSIIKTFQKDAIRRFYHDWYRPDLMAVIVVGTIEPGKAEEFIKKHFSGLVNPAKERPRIQESINPYAKDEAVVVTDKEATGYFTLLNYAAQKDVPFITLGDYKDNIVKDIYGTLLNQRLRELTQKENPPFVYAAGGFEDLSRGYYSFFSQIVTGSNDPVKGVDAFIQELERVKRFGFTASELERAKKNLLNNVERQYNEREKTESGNYVEEYINNFLKKEPIPGIENENTYYKELIPQITLTDVNALSEKLKQQSNKVVALTGPEATGDIVLPTEEGLLAKVGEAEAKTLTAYEEKAIASSLLKEIPKAGKILSTVKNPKLGTTELKLSNGITVTLKPTDYKNDQVLMGAIRPGGENNYGVEDKYSAHYVTEVISSMGIGEFTPVDLKKALAGKTASVSPAFENISDGFKGSSSVKDIETMLQLLYLYVTAPRRDTSLFRSFIQKNKSQSAFVMADPQSAFVDTMSKVMFKNNPLTPILVPRVEYFDKINIDRVLNIYKDHFEDMTGMHFTFVGSFKEEQLKPLIEKYIGGLPATTKKISYVDNKVRPVKGKVDINVNKGKEEKSLILNFYSGEVPYTEDIDLKANAISQLLNIKIIEELREKIQGIYAGAIYAEFSKLPYAHYQFVLYLPCGPDKIDTLLIAANKEIEELKKYGPSQKDLAKIKQQWIEQRKTAIKENNTWLDALEDINFKGNSTERFLNYEKYVNALTAKDIQNAAKLLLSGNNVLTAVLRPELSDAATTTGSRQNEVAQTIELANPNFKVDLYDNGEVDGDSVTVYFNGQVVASKQKLTDKAITLNLKADKYRNNELVMYADNLGSVPPNTALMKIAVSGKTYEVRVAADEKKNAAIRFKLTK